MSTILLALLFLATASAVSDRCYDPRQDFYPYLGTRTAYQLVHGNISRPESNCVPKQIWMLARHGTRYPGETTVPQLLNLPKIRDQIIKNHHMGNGRLCPEDLENLRQWRLDPEMNIDTADLLTSQGREDLFLLAKRLQNAFPELLRVDPRNIKHGDYIFRATNTERTQESLKSFTRGLFGNSRAVTSEVPPARDMLLLPHKNCPPWDAGYQLNQVYAESNSFTAGDEIQDVIRRISRRLGFPRKLDFDTLKAMYEMCRFEAAWYLNRTSIWCTLFSKEDLKVLEYREDLDFYYYCGPGRELSVQLGCTTLTDLFQRFGNLESENFTNQPKGIFYFAHSITLQSLMAALKINDDATPITAATYATAGDRKYRTSLQNSFATNVVVVFYRCDEATANPTNKVTLHVAERLVTMPGCENGLCDWEFLKRELGWDAEQCDLDFCYTSLQNVKETIDEEDARKRDEYNKYRVFIEKIKLSGGTVNESYFVDQRNSSITDADEENMNTNYAHYNATDNSVNGIAATIAGTCSRNVEFAYFAILAVSLIHVFPS